MLRRLTYLLKIYLLTVLFFIVAKLCFMFLNRAGHDFSVADVLDVLRYGLSLDLSTALYFLIVPLLTVLVTVWWNRPVRLSRPLHAYYYLVALAFAMAFVADTSLYPFWGFKLDSSCLQFLSTPGDAFASVTAGYLLLRLAGLAGLAVLMGYLLTRPRLHFAESRHRILSTLFFVAMMPLLVIGIRGGLDESTTNVGQVYYSQQQFLNHSAVNPVFSFLSSFEKSASNNADYHFMDDAACQELTSGLFPTESLDTDTLLTDERPDVVIILLESAGGQFTEIGGRSDIMPHLNRLMQEGIYFENCYANSWRTDRGTVCTLSGYPSFPTTSVMKIPSKTRNLPSIARTLQAEGYQTHYLYGGDINFTNMRGYLVGTGFEKLTWKADYTRDEQASANWGVRDDITFNTLFELLTSKRTPGGQPLLIGYSTLSSHEPWDVPVHHFDDPVLNAFWYLDRCIGDFVSRLQRTEQWKRTLLVLLPDHGINHGGLDETQQLRNHIPMLWLGGVVKAPRRVPQLCNQTDLAATLLGQMHLSHADFAFSRDVLSSNYRYPFAFHTYNNGFSLVDSTGFMVYDLNADKTVVPSSGDVKRLEQLGKALLQQASDDLKKR